MSIVLADRVKETTVTTGTGAVTLLGAALGYQSFSAIGNGSTTYYCISEQGGSAWEVGIGTYNSAGPSLSRTTVLSSSNAGSLVNFGSGTKDVFITYPSEKAIYEEADGVTLINGGPITVVGSGVTSVPSLPAELGKFVGNINSFAQIYTYNQNNGSDASSDFVAYNNATTDGYTHFTDMGLNSSNYTSVSYPIFTPGSGYLFHDGDHFFSGSQTANKNLILFAGSATDAAKVATFSGTDQSTTIHGNATLSGTQTVVGAAQFQSTVLLAADPTLNLQAATKQYVDTLSSTAFVVHASVRLATTAALPTNTYNNGTSGVGATLTATANGALSIDGTAVAVSDRVLVKNEATSAYNGAYVVTQTGNGSTPYILTRATDFDTSAAGEISNNAYFFVTAGATNMSTSWVLAQTAVITVGTTPLPFTLFSSVPTYTGGTNIDVTGQVISLTGTVGATNGGTGTNSVTTGDLLYGTGTNTWGKLAIGSPYKSLSVNAAGTNLEWNAVALNQSGAVSGALPVTNGGTNIVGYTLGDILYAGATDTLNKLAGNTTTTKKFLVQTGTGSTSAAPGWGTIDGADITGNISGSAGSVANALTAGSYLTSGGTFDGSVARTFAVDATDANTANKVVARDASGNFNAGTITASLNGNANSATNIAGGGAGQIPYNTGAGTTAFLAAGTAGYVLQSNGTSAPSWVAPSSSGAAKAYAVGMSLIFG